MGKSTFARMASRFGIAVFDSDAEVHTLLGEKGGALPYIKTRFPDVVGSNGVDRQLLGQKVFKDPAALTDLERILHPLVRKRRQSFLRTQSLRRARFVMLDIPLLFEARERPTFDHIVVVSAPFFLQRDRVLKRPGMTEEKFKSILSHQVSDQEKRRRADTVVSSGLGKRFTLDALRNLLKNLSTKRPRSRLRDQC